MLLDDKIKRLLHPYWCGFSPRFLTWPDDKINLYNLLGPGDEHIEPNVGLINLCWLCLDSSELPKQGARLTTNEKDDILLTLHVLQFLPIGEQNLRTVAALSSLDEFWCILTNLANVEHDSDHLAYYLMLERKARNRLHELGTS